MKTETWNTRPAKSPELLHETPLGRYTRILEMLAIMPRGVVLARVAEIMEVSPGTAHRLLNALCDTGLVERDDSNKTYFLGARMRRLCQMALPTPTLADIARPSLRYLADSYDKTAFLAKLVGEQVEIVATEVPENSSGGYVYPGRIMAPHAAATAKAILAFQSEATWDRVLAGKLKKLSTDTVTDPDLVRAGYRDVIDRGYATCNNEVDPSVQSYAVPIRNRDGQVFHAIGISGFSYSFSGQPVDGIVARMRETAQTISLRLDHETAMRADLV